MNEIRIEDLQSLKHAKTFKNIEQINKGWSNDKKYIIETTENIKLLLRVSDIKYLEQKKKECQVIDQISKLNINTPKFIDLQVKDDKVLQLLTFIEGLDAEESIALLSVEDQYRLGIEAGKILKNIHSVKIIENNSNLVILKNRIIERTNSYKKSKYYGIEDNLAINYIIENIDLIDNAKVVLCHGDYHLGNMVINNKKIGIIDFNRFDYEDRYREFAPMFVFSREYSLDFINGQLDGYFDNNISDDFWKRIKVYLAYVSLYSVLWAEAFGQEEIAGMIRRKQMIYNDFDYFKLEKPLWYLRYQKKF